MLLVVKSVTTLETQKSVYTFLKDILLVVVACSHLCLFVCLTF